MSKLIRIKSFGNFSLKSLSGALKVCRLTRSTFIRDITKCSRLKNKRWKVLKSKPGFQREIRKETLRNAKEKASEGRKKGRRQRVWSLGALNYSEGVNRRRPSITRTKAVKHAARKYSHRSTDIVDLSPPISPS
ncbi:hypothetical protein PUN28_008012 [Cardiocondyla obscurior]|uniref:Uncharacterized protein n=1 Tax=Cardiocondyla obscurior TaxID=286306 RepID=A0AAW2FXV1_9HYME